MIDTLILRIKYPDFNIQNHGAFQPNCFGFFSHPYTPFNGSTNIKSIQNPSDFDKARKNYKPRLTLIKRLGRNGQFPIELKIEFSAPKLIFGNNFKEVDEDDFENVIETLQRKLSEMGVMASYNVLKNADVTTIHFGKNFCFNDHTTASSLISDISKVDLTRRLDLNKTDFRNDGRALYYYSKSHSLVFYDKIQDLKQSESRATEKDSTFNFQTNIFDEIRRKKEVPLEVLRMEVRLCSRQKMKNLLKSYNLPDNLTLQDLFRANISQRVLMEYWDKIYAEARRNALLSRKPHDLLQSVLKIPDLTPQKALTLFAYLELSKTTSERTIYDLISTRFCPRSFQRLKKFMKEHSDKVVYERYTSFDRIRNDILNFQALKKVSLSDPQYKSS